MSQATFKAIKNEVLQGSITPKKWKAINSSNFRVSLGEVLKKLFFFFMKLRVKF